MTRYRKKPIEVEAWQVGSDEPMPEWVISITKIQHGICDFRVETIEGSMLANYGDYIVKGIKGGIYPCRHDLRRSEVVFCADQKKRGGVQRSVGVLEASSATRCKLCAVVIERIGRILKTSSLFCRI